MDSKEWKVMVMDSKEWSVIPITLSISWGFLSCFPLSFSPSYADF